MHLTKKQLQSIAPGQITDWLRGLGFEPTDVSKRWASSFAIFRSLGRVCEEGREISVPLEPSFTDYALRVAETLDEASALLGQSERVLFREILASDQDVIRLRAVGPSLEGGHVPLSTGTRLVESARGLLAAAALSAVKAKSAYQGRQPEQVRVFIDKTKLTPPEPGSFVISALAPVGRSAELTGGEIPFARKATTMLATAIDTVAKAAQNATVHKDYSGLLDAADRGVSANLCEAIAGFVDGEIVRSLEASVQWAGSRPVPDIQAVKRTFSLDVADALRDTAARIRAKEPIDDYQLVGRVVRLESPNSDNGGKVRIAATSGGRPRSVSVQLPPAAYKKAIEAHDSKDIYFSCEGELVIRGRHAELEGARKFELKRLEDD